MSNKSKLTGLFGAPVSDRENSLTAGKRGPLAMQDIYFLEQMAHFDREVIPERRMHAKGSGAFGTFTVTHDITQYTNAKIFSEIGKQTEMFARFSTVAGERGAADAERDIRGFALKFYTEEGNWDLVGNNTPVFFFRDPKLFASLNHVVKRDPKTNMHNPQSNWDFWTLLPEALHQVTILMTDRGIPKGFRNMHGFGSHTYSMYNDAGERVWVKFHFRTQQGIENYTAEEAEQVIAKDRESSQRDLFNAIEEGNFPKWKMYIQVMTEEQARNHKDNPFDLTKVWFKDEYPLIPVGEFELNRNPENYFQDVEQAAFAPTNIIPGIDFSPDKMLQGRLFSYGDAQRYRLGVNHWQIPVNSPKAATNVCPFSRDGQMRVDGNQGGGINYYPNSYEAHQSQPEYKKPGLELEGELYEHDFREDDDNYYEQPGKLFRLQSPEQQQRIFQNTANEMQGTTDEVKHRHIRNCYKADPDYGKGVADALGIDINSVDLEG
ncbi:catalase [Mammaliicoccus sciuri]|uniref:Catalase n=1 Tax=Mammaliicoccus sciuri TaxID=1296 RepID=A0AAJ4SGQ8_MAMSC|nr:MULTISPECIES: catalase [Mammaliicoccus]EZX22625.1 catalase A [Staphylococcus aureus C0673]MBF9298599.1 catalase [Staphylococcus schleiferi]MBN4909013.1 catalase [Staphylococcus sp. EG-SA-13]MCD8836836.1 catalase [Mammaliicoccus sciuri]MCJ0914955.1 catalase [Mammaliicoccus sciuri]